MNFMIIQMQKESIKKLAFSQFSFKAANVSVYSKKDEKNIKKAKKTFDEVKSIW